MNNNIEKIRKSKKMTQEELGKRTGVTRQQIYNVECDIRTASVRLLEKIAEVLEVNLGDLWK